MSDDYGLSPRQWPAIIRKSEHEAMLIRETSPRCDVCGKGVVFKGRTRHYGCEPNELYGKVCICRPGCSDSHWGNGAVKCNPQCVPCALKRGQSLTARRKR